MHEFRRSLCIAHESCFGKRPTHIHCIHKSSCVGLPVSICVTYILTKIPTPDSHGWCGAGNILWNVAGGQYLHGESGTRSNIINQACCASVAITIRVVSRSVSLQPCPTPPLCLRLRSQHGSACLARYINRDVTNSHERTPHACLSLSGLTRIADWPTYKWVSIRSHSFSNSIARDSLLKFLYNDTYVTFETYVARECAILPNTTAVMCENLKEWMKVPQVFMVSSFLESICCHVCMCAEKYRSKEECRRCITITFFTYAFFIHPPCDTRKIICNILPPPLR